MNTESRTVYVVHMSSSEIASSSFHLDISEDRARELSDLIIGILFYLKFTVTLKDYEL